MKGTFDASEVDEVRGGNRKLVYGFFSKEARDSGKRMESSRAGGRG